MDALRSFTEDDFYSASPAFVNADQRPVDLGRDVPQERVGRGMDVQRRGYQEQRRQSSDNSCSGKYPKRWNSPRR